MLKKQKLRDTLLFEEGGEDAPAEENQQIKAKERQWEKDKAEAANEFSCDTRLKRGVIRERGCTDIFCLLLYIVMIGAMCYCALYGFANGQVTKLIAPFDMNQSFCGVNVLGEDGQAKAGEPQYANFQYLYFPKFRKGAVDENGQEIKSFIKIMQTAFCVDKCPGAKAEGFKCTTDANGKTGVDAKIGHYCENGSSYTTGANVPYPTRTLMNFCVPRGDLTSQLGEIWQDFMKDLAGGGMGAYLFDVLNASGTIGICVGTSFLYCLAFIGLVSAFAEPLCWLCIVLVQIGLLGVPCLFGYKFYMTKKSMDVVPALPQQEIDILNSQCTIYILICIAGGLGCCCFALCLYCFMSSIKRAIDVVDSSADFVMATKRILIVPFVYFLLSVLVVCFWFVGYVMVMSINPITPWKSIPQMRTVDWSTETMVYGGIMWFGLLWSLIVIDYAKDFIVLFSASTYYFNSPLCEFDNNGDYILDAQDDPKLVDPEQDGSAEVMLGVNYAHVKHLGSICFAALVITIIKVIRFLFVYVAKKALAATATENSAWACVAKCLIASGECILKCIEKIVDYINHAAMAYMAVRGEHFLSSAWDGMLLNFKWAATFGSAKFFAESLIFLGKAAITVLNVFTCYFLLGAIMGEGVNRDAPCIVVGILTYFTCQIWLTVFDQAILGIMTSLAVDSDVNNGKPCRGPMTFNHKRAQFDEEDDKVAEADNGRGHSMN